MTCSGLSILVMALLVVDIALVAVFFILARRMKELKKFEAVGNAVHVLESLVKDADRMAGQLKEQLQEKNRLVRQFNEELDKKIALLTTLLNRTDGLKANARMKGASPAGEPSAKNIEGEILRLRDAGHDQNEIAHRLSITKEQVKLILDLRRRVVGQEGAT